MVLEKTWVPWTARKSNQSIRKSVLNVHWKDWCWSWSSNSLATCYEEPTHWKRPWCWERLKAGGERDNKIWDGWMASPIQWTWVWVNSGRYWRTRKPGVLQFMGSKRAEHDWVTEWQRLSLQYILQLHVFGSIRWVNQRKHPTLFFLCFSFSKLLNTSPNLMESTDWFVISQVKPPTWNDKKPVKMIYVLFAKLENLCKFIQQGLLTTLTNKVSTRIFLLILSIPCFDHNFCVTRLYICLYICIFVFLNVYVIYPNVISF